MSTRERVLGAAIELLGTQGLRALTHVRVDEAAGVPKGSTSNYFRTRAALVAGVVEQIANEELAGQGAPGALPVTVEGFVGLLAGTVEQLTGPFRVRTTARYTLFLEGTHAPHVRELLTAGRARFRAFAEAGMEAFGAPDPVVAATAVMAVGDGMILHRLTVDPDEDVAAPLDAVVRAFVPGVAAGAFTRPQVEAVAALAVAEEQKAALTVGGAPAGRAAAADVVERAVPDAAAQQRFARTGILWVDDMPENNPHERAALRALGARVDSVATTDAAMARLTGGGYDLVVTDMSRPEGRRAGYLLLERVQAAGLAVPLVIYAASASSAEVDEARARGAAGRTSSPGELVKLVAEAVLG
jgi:DNA-binding transcriptional regulator YbjK